MIGARGRALIVVLAVLGLGTLIGSFHERHFGESRTTALIVTGDHDARRAHLIEFLELDEAQVTQIDAVLAEQQAGVQRLWEQLRPEVQSAMQRAHLQISELLRPEQRELYHRWLSRHPDLDPVRQPLQR